MNIEHPIAVLFDFDGVIMDTESQYTLFWDEKGKKHHPEIANFGHHIKGQTLTQLYEQYFLQPEGLQEQITQELNEFETKMEFPYIPAGGHCFYAAAQWSFCLVGIISPG